MIGFILILLFLTGMFFLLSIQRLKPLKKQYKLKKPYLRPRTMPNDFVPVEDHIVPTHASHTNKMNNMLGNVNSSQGVDPGLLEVVIPSDFYQFSSRPGEYYWPSGSILPDYIFNQDGVHQKIVVQ